MGFLYAIIAAMLLVPIGLVVAVQLGRASSHRKRQLGSWRPIAEQQGGRFKEIGSGFGHHGMIVPVRGVDVVVTVVNGIAIDKAIASRHRSTGGWHTQADGAFIAGAGVAFEVRRRGMFDGNGYLGIGDDELHKQFYLASDSPAFGHLWSPAATQLMKQIGRDGWVISGGNMVTVVLPGFVDDSARLQAAIGLVGELVANAAALQQSAPLPRPAAVA